METNNHENNGLGQLVAKLKKEDSFYAEISKIFQVIYWIFIPVYILLTLREYTDSYKIGELIGGACFILAFLIFALLFRKYYREYKNVDYSLPTLQMLKKAAWRYRPFQIRSLWALLALIFMDAGLASGWVDEKISMLIAQLMFWGVMFFAIIIGFVVWYIKYKPLYDETKKMIKEIEA